MFALGLAKDLPDELVVLKTAAPALHTVAVFLLTMALCIWALPSLHSVDEHATIETFRTSVFKEGFLAFSPTTIGFIRLAFAFVCFVTTLAKIRRGTEFKVVRLPGSKLRGGLVQMRGWRTQAFFTSWAWNILGASFFLGGLIPLLDEGVVKENPWLLRAALVSFEVAAPCAMLTSVVVTYALWPQAFKEHGASGTLGFKGWINLMQHDGNTAMVLFEVCLLGGLPVMLSHAAFAPIFAGVYQLSLWLMVNQWSPNHGPVYPYFFMDTTLGARTTVFMVILLVVIAFFFAVFALLDMVIEMIEAGGHGALPNVGCVLFLSWLLMKFKD